MSIINQMLRELDARGVAVGDAPVLHARASVKKRRFGMPAAAGLLVAVAGGAAYWMLMAAPAKQMPPTSAMPASQNGVPAILVIAPPSPAEPRGEGEKHTLPALPRIQMTTSLSLDALLVHRKPEPAIQHPTALPVQAQADSSVIKKLTELSPEAEAQQLYDDAQSLRRAGKLDAAVGKYQQALEHDPAMRPARLQLAGLLQGSGRPDAALQVLKAGYEHQPSDALAIAAGRMLADQGHRDEALNWLERGRAGLRPADFALMGALLSQTQRFDEAAKSYQRALTVNPNQGGWLLGLGLAFEAMGRMNEARAAYRKALEHGEFKPDVIEFLQQKSGKSG